MQLLVWFLLLLLCYAYLAHLQHTYGDAYYDIHSLLVFPAAYRVTS